MLHAYFEWYSHQTPQHFWKGRIYQPTVSGFVGSILNVTFRIKASHCFSSHPLLAA